MDVKKMVEDMAQRFQATASVATVYGEPMEAEGKTLIPVARVSYGFGAGIGRGRGEEGDEDEEGPSGSGAGGGVNITPVGVIEVTPGDTRFIPVGQRRRLMVTFLMGLLVGRYLLRRGRG